MQDLARRGDLSLCQSNGQARSSQLPSGSIRPETQSPQVKSHSSGISPQPNVSIITTSVIHLENTVFLMLTLKKQSVPHPSIQMAPILNNSFEMESKYIQIDVSEMSCILNTFA